MCVLTEINSKKREDENLRTNFVLQIPQVASRRVELCVGKKVFND